LQQIPDNYHFVNNHARRAPVAIYNVSLGHDDRELVVMYPVTTIPLEDFPPGMRITSVFEGDGATKTFRLPYIKRTKYGAAR